MKKREKLGFILNNICNMKKSVVFAFAFCITIMGLAPVMQLKVLEKIIEVLGKSVEKGLSEQYIIEGIILIIAEGILFIIVSMMDNISELTNSMIVLNIQHNTKTVIAKKMKSIELEFFDNPDLLDLYQNSLTQVDSAITEMVNLVTSIGTLIIGFGGYVGLIFGTNKFTIFLILITTFPMMMLKIRFKKIYYTFVIDNTKSNRKKDYYFDVLTKHEYFKEQKLYNTTDFFLEKREAEYKLLYKKSIKVNLRGCIESFVANLIGRSGAVVCIIWMFMDTIRGKLPISKFTSVFYAIINIQDSFEAIFNVLSTSYESFLYFNLFFEFINYNTRNKDGTKLLNNEKNIKIEFVNVSFKYFGVDNYILKDVNFKIEGNGIFMIVGENGSGKSTIMKLLLRLYEPTSGKILINDIDICEYKQSEIRKVFSMMFQDYNKYALSLKDNIVISNLEAEKKFSEEIAEHKFDDINKIANIFPKKYNTEMTKLFDKDGIELSIGQWQRVAIARSIFMEGNIFILDEPLAFVDALAEKEILNMMCEKCADKTFIVISHNFSMAKMASN